MQLLIARKINGTAFSSAPAALTHEVFLGSCHCQRAPQEPYCCEQWGTAREDRSHCPAPYHSFVLASSRDSLSPSLLLYLLNPPPTSSSTPPSFIPSPQLVDILALK